MKPTKKPMTMDEFLALSSKERKAMSAKEYAPFLAQMAVRNLNHNVAAQDQADQKAPLAKVIERIVDQGPISGTEQRALLNQVWIEDPT